jgi:L-fuconolactonase
LNSITMEKIDAHQHFWQLSQPFEYGWLDKPELKSIRRDYLPSDLKLHLESCQISGSIFVQTQHNLAENRWVLGMCDQYPFIKGIVGWVDLASEACETQILEMQANPHFLGVRHVVQDEADDDFLIRPEILRGLSLLEKHDLPFDVLIYVKHLKHVPTLARKLPNLKMVINHLAKPQIADGELRAWQNDFEACAQFENVWCKLSGMVTEADWNNWKANDLKPYIEIAIDAFSPKRLMFGSDWPVCELAGTYKAVHDALAMNISQLTEAEQARIFAGSAREFYQLQN